MRMAGVIICARDGSGYAWRAATMFFVFEEAPSLMRRPRRKLIKKQGAANKHLSGQPGGRRVRLGGCECAPSSRSNRLRTNPCEQAPIYTKIISLK